MSHDDKKILEIKIVEYKEKIEDIIVECEHVYRLTIDYEMLDQKVLELMASAKEDGLSNKAFWDLIQATIPSYINYINHKASGKKAA